MKTINFKNICHKFQFIWLVVALIGAFSLFACSDDDDDKATTSIEFPDLQTIYVTAGDNTTLNFTASARFILTSSQNWCTFDGEISYSGEAGQQQVPLTISTQGLSQDSDDEATITMTMEGEAKAIATVIRSASGVEVTIYDEEDNEVSQMMAGYSSYNYYTITANFEFTAIELPEWLDIDGVIYSTSGTPVKFGLKVKDESAYYKYRQETEIAIGNRDTTITYPINIVYEGMDPEAIVISRATTDFDIIRIPTFNWVISQDGKTFSNEGDKYTPTFTVDVLNDDYVIVKIERIGNDYKFGVDSKYNSSKTYSDVTWQHITDDSQGNISFTVDAIESGSRQGYILAFPRSSYETIQEDLLNALVNVDDEDETEQSEQWDIRYKYLQNNTLIGFTQAEESTDVFIVVNGINPLEVYTLEDNYSGSYYTTLESKLQSEYATTDIQWLQYDANQWTDLLYPINYLITPLPLDKEAEWAWDAIVFDADGNNAEAADSPYNLAIEPQSYDGTYPCLGFQMLEDPHMAFYMVFTDTEGKVRIFVLYDK